MSAFLRFHLNQVLSLLLSVAIATAPVVVVADTEKDSDTQGATAATRVLAPDGTELEISVTAVETSDEANFIAELATQSPDGVVVLNNVATGSTASTQPIFEVVQFQDAQSKPSLLKRIKSKIKSFAVRHSDRVKGTLIAVSSASTGGFGAYYLAGASLEHSAYLAASMFTVATLQATFTHKWSALLASGGNAAVKLGQVVAEKLNRKMKHSNWLASTGEIVTAAIFNVIATSSILYMTDSFQSLKVAALVGILGAYDYTFDIAMRQLEKDGKLTSEQTAKTIKGRVMVGPVLETLSLAGFGPARVVMGVIGIAGIFAIYKGQSAYDALIAKKHFIKVQTKTNTLVLKAGDVLSLIAATKNQSCESILQSQKEKPFVADDIQ